MILECPDCSAKFKIPDGAVGADGRKVKCGKCAHVWWQMPDGATKTMEEAQPPEAKEVSSDTPVAEEKPAKKAPDIDEVLKGKTHKIKKEKTLEDIAMGDYTPPATVRIARKKHRIIMYWAAVTSMMLIIGLLWSLNERPDWYGFTDSKGMAFEKIKLEPMPRLGGDRFTMNPIYKISGTVRNVSDQPKVLPTIRVTLVDTEGEMVYNQYYNDHKMIPAGDKVDFVMENLEQAERRHTHFVIEMGNMYELTMRSVELAHAN